MMSWAETISILLLIVAIVVAISITWDLGFEHGKRTICEAWNIAEKPRQKYFLIIEYDEENKPYDEFIKGFAHSANCGMEIEYVEKWLEEEKNE